VLQAREALGPGAQRHVDKFMCLSHARGVRRYLAVTQPDTNERKEAIPWPSSTQSTGK
jgi:hypothetical protein